MEKIILYRGKGGNNFSETNLFRVDFSEANLSGIDFSRADLFGTNFSGADLSETDFSEADLSRANFSDANLFKANFFGANLFKANLSETNLSRANFFGANLLNCIGNGKEIITTQTEIWTVTRTATVMQIGCQRHLILDWWEFEDDEIDYMDQCALKWWKKWKPILQAMIEVSPAKPTKLEKDHES